MPFQENPTLLTIPRWGALIGIHPLHLQGVDLASSFSTEVVCGQPIFQWSFQDNSRTSREDIAGAISTAEEMLREELGFSVLPDWTIEENDVHDQDWRPEIYPWPQQAVRGMPRTQTLKGGMFIGGGQRATAVISAGAAIAYTDTDGDGYLETATVTAATTVTDVNQIAVFYRAVDTPNGGAADPEWEIRPLRVSITGGVVTIRFRRELAVKATLILPLEPVAVDGAIAGNFLTTVDVYQRYTDPATSFRAEWEPGAGGCDCTGLTVCASCSYSVQTGCLLGHDDRLGIVRLQPGTYDTETAAWSTTGWSINRAPDRVTSWYRAGYRDQRRARPYYDMDPLFERCVAYMAAALLERPLCGCSNVTSFMAQWREDLAQSISQEPISQSWSVSDGDLSNPFGTRRGMVWAWQRISNRQLGRAAVA